MSSKLVKDSLSIDDICRLLNYFDAEPKIIGANIESKTICHGGEKRKLYYYPDKKYFHCYTDCAETFDIFRLVSKVMAVDFPEAYKFVVEFFNLKSQIRSAAAAEEKEKSSNLSFFSKFKALLIPVVEYESISESILNNFWDLYHKQWLREFITVEAMKKFNIKFSIVDNAIIIPHRHWETGKIIGIRQRNFEQQLIDEGKKYIPIYHKKKVLKHATGGNLYGLYENAESIRKHRKIIIFESEKSVLQLMSQNPDFSIGVAISGSSLTDAHKQILKNFGNIDEVIIALDKEFTEVGDAHEILQREKIIKMSEGISQYFCVSVIYDAQNCLDLKQSPTDNGRDIFNRLYRNRITITNI